MITNGFTYVAVLLFMAAVLVTLEKGMRTYQGGRRSRLSTSASVDQTWPPDGHATARGQ